MDEQELKKFGEIAARFRKLEQQYSVSIENGEFIRMIWSGVIPEVMWLVDRLVEAYGEPPVPKEEDPLGKGRKKAVPMKRRVARLANVAANKGTDADVSVEETDL